MKRILQFTAITFGFSWLMWGLQYLGQEKILPEWFQIFGMLGLFGPFIAFIVMTKFDNRAFKDVFKTMFEKAPLWSIAFALISPMVLSAIAYLLYLRFASGETEAIGVSLLSIIPIAFMILFVGGPIEEFGWRGYLLPKLRAKMGVMLTIIILGFIHGLWHLPLHYLNGTVQQALPIYEFLIVTVSITVSYVFLFEYTKSLIPMILLHWFANLSSAIFPYFYSEEGRYSLFALYVLFDIILLLILFLRQKKEHIL